MEDIFGMLNFFGGNSTMSDILSALVGEFMPYGIYNVPLLLQCTDFLIHVVSMMRGCLFYYE